MKIDAPRETVQGAMKLYADDPQCTYVSLESVEDYSPVRVLTIVNLDLWPQGASANASNASLIIHTGHCHSGRKQLIELRNQVLYKSL